MEGAPILVGKRIRHKFAGEDEEAIYTGKVISQVGQQRMHSTVQLLEVIYMFCCC